MALPPPEESRLCSVPGLFHPKNNRTKEGQGIWREHGNVGSWEGGEEGMPGDLTQGFPGCSENWEMDPWGTLGGMDAEERMDHRLIIIVIINPISC